MKAEIEIPKDKVAELCRRNRGFRSRCGPISAASTIGTTAEIPKVVL